MSEREEQLWIAAARLTVVVAVLFVIAMVVIATGCGSPTSAPFAQTATEQQAHLTVSWPALTEARLMGCQGTYTFTVPATMPTFYAPPGGLTIDVVTLDLRCWQLASIRALAGFCGTGGRCP